MLRLGLTACLIFASTYVWAEEDTSFTNYDSIINDLKASINEMPEPTRPRETDWNDVALHGGLAFATSLVSPVSPNGTTGTGLLKGVEASLGSNLFSKSLRIEGAFSTYAQDGLQNGLKADLREFQGRLVYLSSINDKSTARFGLGLVESYMTLDDGPHIYDSTTLSTMFILGYEHKIAQSLTIGPDLSYRSAINSNAIDKSAWNASFRLNATF